MGVVKVEYPYCKRCQAKGIETNTHSTTEHEEEPRLWALVAKLIVWAYQRRTQGDMSRGQVLETIEKQFEALTA